jgi:hypothetical protein
MNHPNGTFLAPKLHLLLKILNISNLLLEQLIVFAE